MEKGGIYIHFPYCRNKCFYCDFFSGNVKNISQEIYINSILNELKYRSDEIKFSPETIYIGGGTPSLLNYDNLRVLIQGIKNILNIKEFKEFTLEANPEDINTVNLQNWKFLGINRLSVGIQSLNDQELVKIGRFCNSNVALRAIELIAAHYENFNLDVIFGLPDQTLESWQNTLQRIADFNPPHLSAYALMLEKGSVLYHKYKKNILNLPDEETTIRMWTILNELMFSKGYDHYEISNFAKPEFHSHHNYNYWIGKPYMGLGPAAHSFDGSNKRKWNKKNLKSYVDFYSNVQKKGNDINEILFSNIMENEILNSQELKEEYILTRLRINRGLSLTGFMIKFGEYNTNELIKKSRKLIDNNQLFLKEDHLIIPEDKWIISDSIISELF